MADDKLDAPAFLRMLAQNDYMIDKGTLPDGKRLEEIATEIENLLRVCEKLVENDSVPELSYGEHDGDICPFCEAEWEYTYRKRDKTYIHETLANINHKPGCKIVEARQVIASMKR